MAKNKKNKEKIDKEVKQLNNNPKNRIYFYFYKNDQIRRKLKED